MTKLIIAKILIPHWGVNDMKELSVAEKILQDSLRDKALKQGVHMKSPETVFYQKIQNLEECNYRPLCRS